jgi:4'-phosphopantetheinyl transferase
MSRPTSRANAVSDAALATADIARVAAALGDAQVHLWRLPLHEPPCGLGPVLALLDDTESQRYRRFAAPVHARRFAVARAMLRVLLGAYGGHAPAELRFDEGHAGKPRLAAAFTNVRLDFNVSHSAEVAVVGIARGLRLGVDVEVVRTVPNHEAIAHGNFAPAEYERLMSLAPERRLAGFFAGWTRKEACVKAIGSGLSAPLDRFEVTLDPDAPAALLSIDGSAAAAAAWSLWGFESGEGVWVAAAADAAGLELQCFRLDTTGFAAACL